MSNPEAPGWYRHNGGERYWDGSAWKLAARVPKPDGEFPVWPPGSIPSSRKPAHTKSAADQITNGIFLAIAIALVGGFIGGMASEENPGSGLAVIALSGFLSTIVILPALIAKGVSLGMRHHVEGLEKR